MQGEFDRKPDDADELLPRHMIWRRTARALLALPPTQPSYTDYMSSMLASADARGHDGHHGPPMDHRDRRAAPFLRVDVLRCVHCAGRLVRFGRPTQPGVLGRRPVKTGEGVDFLRGVRPTDVAAMISAPAPCWRSRARPLPATEPRGPQGTGHTRRLRSSGRTRLNDRRSADIIFNRLEEWHFLAREADVCPLRPAVSSSFDDR